MKMNDDEILRLRERYHSLNGEVAAMKYRINSLENWRTEHMREAEKALDELKQLMDTDRTGKAVALALKKRNKLELTFLQRAAGVAIFTLSIATAIKTFIGG